MSVLRIAAEIGRSFNRVGNAPRVSERIQFHCSVSEACIAASNAPADATAKLDLV